MPRVAIGLRVVRHGLALVTALNLELRGSPDSIGKAFQAGFAIGVRADFKLEPGRAPMKPYRSWMRILAS